ncbi:hypothetical protein FOCC_FOCC013883 [Frankliniella occidentalis]|nr:hypothetical protein FOCC_FOCC013883 [Frankliniella occidentalis]
MCVTMDILYFRLIFAHLFVLRMSLTLVFCPTTPGL